MTSTHGHTPPLLGEPCTCSPSPKETSRPSREALAFRLQVDMGAAEAPELLTECTAPPWGLGRTMVQPCLGKVRSLPRAAPRGARRSSPKGRATREGRGRPEAPCACSHCPYLQPSSLRWATGVQRQLGKPCPWELTPSSCAHAHVVCASVQPCGPPQGRWGLSGDQTPARHRGRVWMGLGSCLRPWAQLRWGGAQIGSELPMTPQVCRPGSRLCVARGHGRVVWTDLEPGRGG